jgi:hypothetical protein
MKNKPVNRKFDVARQMPPMRHYVPGTNFDIRESEVAKWLCSQPGIMQYVFDKVASSSNGLNLIKYDPTTEMWRGIAW